MGIKNILNKLRGREDIFPSPYSLSEEAVETQKKPQPSIKKEGDNFMNKTGDYATGKVIAKGQITLVDLTDVISQSTPPVPAKEDMLWMDTSKTPPVLMVYKGGKWIKQNDFKDDPQYNIIKETLTKNTSDIQVNKENISLKVNESQVTDIVIEKINDLEIGSGNFILDSSFVKKENSYSSDGEITVDKGEISVFNGTQLKMSLGSSFGAMKRADDVVLSSIATVTSTSSSTGLNKVIGGNINVYSEDYEYIVKSVKDLKINLITVPLVVTVANNSSTPTVPGWGINRAKAYLDNLSRAGLITNKTRLIFEPHLLVDNGSVSETEYNPANKNLFFSTWKELIVKSLTVLSEYEFYGIYVGTNFQQFDTGEANIAHWEKLVKELKILYGNHQIIYRTNWWVTASWSEELQTAYEAKVNNPLWDLVDIISIAAYFELNEKAVPTSDELFNDIMNGTSINGRGQNVFSQVKAFYDKWRKPVMFGELGCPSKQFGAKEPWSNLTSNTNNEDVQKNLFEAYNRAFIYDNGVEDNSWFLGYSIFTLGTSTSEYNVVNKKAQQSIVAGMDYINNNSISNIRIRVVNKNTNNTIAEMNLPLSPAMNSVESTTTKLIIDGGEENEIIFYLTPDTTFRMSKPMLSTGTKAIQWSPSVQDSEHRFTEISDKFTEVNAQLGELNMSVGEITTANYATCNNTALEFIIGTGSGINAEVKNKVKESNIPIDILGGYFEDKYLTVTKIISLSPTNEIIDELNYPDGLVLRKSKTNTSIYDMLTTKGVLRKIDTVTLEDLEKENYYYDKNYNNLIKVTTLGKLKFSCNLPSISTIHTVPLTVLANIENSVSSIQISKNQIEQKVDVNGVIAAINIGVEDNESSVKIMAEKIKLTGAVTVESLSGNLSQMFEVGSDKTVINGGYIKSGTVDLTGELWTSGITVYEKKIGEDGNLEVGPDGNYVRGEQSLSISDRGEVNIKGNIQSMNFDNEKGLGWEISKDGAAVFNQGEFRSKIILPRAGMSNEGNVRIWAGGNTPGTALFRVLDSGDCYIEKGHFKGVFSGSVEVGGITITDEGKNSGRASIKITNNVEKLVTEIADDILTVGTDSHFKNKLIVDNNEVKINDSSFNFNNKILFNKTDSSISFNNDFANFKVSGTKFVFKVNDSTQSTDFEFSNSRRDAIVEIKGQLKVTSNVDIGVVTIRRHNEGIDFLFI